MPTEGMRPAPPHAWRPGQSGNPAGRKPGSGEIARLRAGIAEHVPAIIEQLKTAALAGDVGAARLLLERVLPPIKAMEEHVHIELKGDKLVDQARAVLDAAATGQIAPGQASALVGTPGAIARIVEFKDLIDRVDALERAQTGSRVR